MEKIGGLILDVSYDILEIICGFLKINEINQLATTCKEFYNLLFIHSVKSNFNHLV